MQVEKISLEELQRILEGHGLWLWSRGTKGCRANLSRADLYQADLRGANLSNADLRQADLRGSNLSWADLSCADLYRANLPRAILYKANLKVATAKDCWIYRAKFSSPKDRARLLMLGARE